MNSTKNITDSLDLGRWMEEKHTNSIITEEKTLEQWNYEFYVMQRPVLIVVSALLVTGILGNSSVIYVYFVRFKRYNEMRFYIPVLAVTDLSVCVVNSGVLLSDVFFWVAFPSDILCKTMHYLALLTTMDSIAILLLIAVDRYKTVSDPLRIRTGIKRKKMFVVLIIFVSIVASIPVLFYFGAAVVWSKDGTLSGYRCKIVYNHTFVFVYAFHVLWLSIGVSILIALSVLYALVYRHVRKPKLYSGHERNGSVNSVPTRTNKNCQEGAIEVISDKAPEYHNDAPASCPTKPQRAVVKSLNTKLTIVFAVITFVFAICIIPKLVLMMLSSVKEDFWDMVPDHQLWIYRLLHSVYIFHSALDPAIYSLCDTKFRKELKRICQCVK